MNETELVLLAVAAAFAIADGLESDDVLTFGDFFTMIGTNLTAIADARGKCESKNQNNQTTAQPLDKSR